jgi:glycosyltransferase involved in cell wall biosynthesis
MELAYNFNATPKLIYHSSYYRVPRRPKGPVVVHVYDMIQELFGSNLKTISFKKKSFDAANLIISISESTKKDLCELYPIDPQKVIIAYPGVNEVFRKARGSTKRVKERPYMLYIGARSYNYKNFDFLLDTFINRKYFLDFDLILGGGEKDLMPQQKEKIKNTIRGGNWLLQEFCDDEKLADLYSSASVFIYPSLYEGFGIPLIEAMACGCPVVASNASSIPEVVSNAALLFNPKDPNDLTRQIDRIVNDRFVSLDLIKKGKIRAQQFTWKTMADTIYKGYLSLL